MSYDLYLYRTTGTAAVGDAHQECADHFEADRPPPITLSTPWEPEELESLATLLTTLCPELEVIRPGGISAGSIMLEGPADLPATWELGPMSLSVTWPYGRSREEFERIFERVARGLSALQGRGARVYDPQLDIELEPERDFDAVAAAYEGVNDRVFGTTPAPDTRAAKPWWKFW